MTNTEENSSVNNTTTPAPAAQPMPDRRLGQMKLLALFGIAMAPVLLAAFMYFGNYGVPDTSTNNGTLVLPPLQAESVPILAEVWQRDSMKQIDDKPKWLLSVVGDTTSLPAEALERDQPALYIARQVTVAVGKDQDRIAYGWLQQGLDPQDEAATIAEHSKLQMISLDASAEVALAEWLASAGITAQTGDLVLADPNGNFIMYYPKSTDGKAILEDLKRLLKVSKIG